jgi:hypothetical protein
VPSFSGAERSFIEPGSPWQNPFVESFGSRVRDEVLSVEAFDSAIAAQTINKCLERHLQSQTATQQPRLENTRRLAATVTEGAQHNRPQLS